MLTVEARYSVHVAVNGAPVDRVPGGRAREGGVMLEARHGDVAADTCTLLGLTELECGHETRMMIQPAQWEEGRRMSGKVAYPRLPERATRRVTQRVIVSDG